MGRPRRPREHAVLNVRRSTSASARRSMPKEPARNAQLKRAGRSGAAASRPIPLPSITQHLREFGSRPHAWAVLARNLIPVIGIYAFGWSAALSVFNYWFDGLTAVAAILAALVPRAL